MTAADVKARVVAAYQRAVGGAIERVDNAPAPAGWTVWRVGGPDGPCTALPTLDPRAPLGVHRRYLARVTATCTGRCPECGAVAGVSIDPSDRPAAWRVLPVTIGLRHATACPATFTDSEKIWFPVYRGEDL